MIDAGKPTRVRLPAVLACVLCAAALPAHAAWLGVWGAAPQAPNPAMGFFPATPSFNDQTLLQVVRISAGGRRVRVRFTNEYGTRPLVIGAARIAIADAAGHFDPASSRALTFNGQPGISIPAGAPFISDPVALPVKALAQLAISIYLPGDTGPATGHFTGQQTAYVSGPGDFTARTFTPQRKLQSRAFISGVDVDSTAPRPRAIVLLADSITDGVGSTPDANHRWPDLLADRLAARPHGALGVVNMGISGNRLLVGGMGDSALSRFDRDVLSVPGAAYLIVFLGVNDLGMSYRQMPAPGAHPGGPGARSAPHAAAAGGPAPASGTAPAPHARPAVGPGNMLPPEHATAEDLIAGYRQLIERAHAHRLKIYAATITPYGGASYYSPAGEAVRQVINHWIRTSGAFDGVLDFDAAWRDPADPTRITAGLHAGDHLHGSDAGYRRLADSIDLSLFN
ncbi:MAG TPA: SGNH/GDSL hydrolase family protein [Steroidobacteraceae bacterium]|nr:SGNH/GDSL hydrolase family protein [Steroidobacteraceae bacterium]